MSQLSDAIKRYVATQGSAPPVVAGLWSNPATWGGSLPVDGDAITIPFGTAITLDTTTAKLGSLTVSGDLIVSTTVDTWLKTNQMVVTSTGRYMSGGWSTATIPMPLTPNPRKHRRTMTGPQKAGTVKGYTHDPVTDVSTGNNGTTNDDSGIRRGLLVMDGGKYLINAARPAILKTQIQGHHMAGATSLTLKEGVSWKAGDEIIIYGTDFPDGAGTQSRCERRFLASDASGSTIALTAALTYDHWGLLQYPTDTGISLTAGPFTDGSANAYVGSISGATLTITSAIGTISVGQRVRGVGVLGAAYIMAFGTGTGGTGTYTLTTTQTLSSRALKIVGMKPHANIPTVIDQRAKVMLLTRSHVVDGDTDLSNSTSRFSAHEMYMGISHITKVIGMQYAQCGQGGLVGRYPMHDHLNAYNPDGTTRTNPFTGLSDGMYAPNQRLHEDCSVTDSFNRLQDVHGTRGGVFKNLVGDNIKGHAYFCEDGSEVFNTWDSCHVSRAVDPGSGWRLKIHDGPENSTYDGLPMNASGWWLSNNDNSIISTTGYLNSGVECDGFGFVNNNQPNRVGFPGGCFGASSQVPLQPYFTPTLAWSGVECHGNRMLGRASFAGVISEAGRMATSSSIGPGRPRHNIDKNLAGDVTDKQVGMRTDGDILWKNQSGALQNNESVIDYRSWTLCDNKGTDINGNVDQGRLRYILWVDQSLNNWSGTATDREGLVSYHGQGVVQDSAVFGYGTKTVPQLTAAPSRFQGKLRIATWLGSTDTYLFPLVAYTAITTNVRFTSAHNYYTPAQPSLQAYAPFTTWSGGNTSITNGSGSNATYDPFGYLFGAGEDVFGIADHPVVTYGTASPTSVTNDLGQYIGQVSTTTAMYGLQRDLGGALYSDGTSADGRPVAWQRVDPSTGADVSGAFVVLKTDLVAEAGRDCMLDLPENGWARIYNPVDSTKKWKYMGFELHSVLARSPGFIGIGIPWANADAFKYGEFGTADIGATVATSFADLQTKTVQAYWRDTTNQIVWIKIKQSTFNQPPYINPLGTYFQGSQAGTYLTTLSFHT